MSTWRAAVRTMVVTDAKQVARDRFLGFMLAYSIVLALAVRLGVPPLTTFLQERHEIDVVPYYGLIGSFIALTIGSSMVGLLLGFLLLEARETRLVEAVSVSPLTFERFLAYRVGMPMLLGVVMNPLCAWIGGIGLPALGPALAISVVGAILAGICTLALPTYADNKVQAFAVMKLISAAGIIPMAAYFVGEPAQYAFGFFPPYWIFKAWWVATEGGAWWWLHCLIGAASNVLLLLWMKRRFERVVHRAA